MEGRIKFIPKEQSVRHTDASSAKGVDFQKRSRKGQLPQLIVGRTTEGKVIRTVFEPTNVPRE